MPLTIHPTTSAYCAGYPDALTEQIHQDGVRVGSMHGYPKDLPEKFYATLERGTGNWARGYGNTRDAALDDAQRHAARLAKRDHCAVGPDVSRADTLTTNA